MEVLRRCPLAIAQRLVYCAIALSTAVLDRVTKTMSVAPLLMNNLDNSKQKTSNLLSPAPPPYSWSLLGKSEGPAPPPSSNISWSFDLAWSPVSWTFFGFWLLCCFTSTEAGWPIRDGDRVGRGQGDWLDRGNRPKKTGETVDRRQNNGSVKAVSPRHCPATCALRNCSFNCCAGQSH